MRKFPRLRSSGLPGAFEDSLWQDQRSFGSWWEQTKLTASPQRTDNVTPVSSSQSGLRGGNSYMDAGEEDGAKSLRVADELEADQQSTLDRKSVV